WWGGWLQQSLQAVKDKSSEALEFLKRDLTEFSTVVQHDTTCSIVATANAVRSKLATEGSSETTEKLKKSISGFLGVISETLAPPPDKTIDCDVITLMATPTGTTEVYDSSKGPPEQFENWLSTFRLEEMKGEISELLVNSPSIRALYTKMVPAAVSHSEFWQRYFYKVFQLDQEEARRVALKQRAEQIAHTETLGWEEEEEDDFLGPAASDGRSKRPGVSLTGAGTAAPAEERDAALSVSSESGSLPTQVEAQPPAPAAELADRLTEASLEEERKEAPVAEQVVAPPQPAAAAAADGDPARPPVPASRSEATKEEGPQDLRVFELNSDSGKSTPSNNGKKGSSTDVSEDWEKDFDLDMTEEEVQMALSKIESSGELEEDWENWD
ncbi:unnamed protein product, partial [Tetraodon nigroviridis]